MVKYREHTKWEKIYVWIVMIWIWVLVISSWNIIMIWLWLLSVVFWIIELLND
jgi:hypothetical protein